VITTFEQIQDVVNTFENTPDEQFCNGKGKKFLYIFLLSNLKLEDEYFNNHLDLINQNNDRWINFMDDCVLLHVLHSYLFNMPIGLLHPESHKKIIDVAVKDVTDGLIPSLISGIPIQPKMADVIP